MRITSNHIVQHLAKRLGDPERPKPLLLLGAGCSLAAGLPDAKDLLARYKVGSLHQLIDRLQDEITLRSTIKDQLHPVGDSSAYDLLGFLTAKGYFDVILTTNWDFLLETSLAHYLSPDQYRVFVRPQIPDGNIAEALQREVPRVKVLKLHGDTLCKPILAPTDLMRFDKSLTAELERLAEQRGLIIIGYGLKEPRFFRILDNVKPIVVSPEDYDEGQLQQFGVGAQHVGDEEGDFGVFVQCLSRIMLGTEYRKLLSDQWSPAGSFGPVMPDRERRRRVQEIYGKVKERFAEHNIEETRVWQLTHQLLTEIRSRYHDAMDPSKGGICLVFVMDSMAPGGTEIYRLTQVNEDIQALISGMEIQSIEIVSRYGGERRVRTWIRTSEHSDLSKFDAVVLIDSVSFTGHTLELARDYLAKEGRRPRDRFSAGLLLLPREAEQRLRHGAGAVTLTNIWEPWWDVLSPSGNYSGFEVTFPWGWTTATMPLEGKRSGDAEPFIAWDEFSFIPKPWGEQLIFCKDERVTVSLLVLSRGQRTSTHLHLVRTETFVVLDGRLRLCLWDYYLELRRNESIRIPPGVPHALIALDQACRVLEVASGPYDLARDIIRLSDNYGRAKNPDGSDDGLI